MTCKDCVHYDVCKEDVELHRDFYDCLEVNGVEKHCEHYKPKSRFVELPCEVGQTVWMPFEGEATPLTIYRVSIVDEIGKDLIRFFDAKFAKVATSFSDRHIGKTVFLSREEAEKALSERSK